MKTAHLEIGTQLLYNFQVRVKFPFFQPFLLHFLYLLRHLVCRILACIGIGQHCHRNSVERKLGYLRN